MDPAGGKDTQVDPTVATYQFRGEDHTLGNAMRNMLMKDPDVEFAGYSVPHPLQDYMNLRVQTHKDTKTADEAVVVALDGLTGVCDHILKTYKKAVKKYEREREAREGAMEVEIAD
eukprot:CAMPEP_0179293436 /NCGR_PEP_ID=MMETSP0797-20121207/43372_1 /TAXON_ID=47934 /ORGANISM="Dinophysis acuminata, Strain DAEP01" /LENGTH=115 /DNA_ID=CAMNT_0021002583 /DNA_START=40 /DNA_END=387 /DNA_ORIENTATION=+